jgi:peptide/nickel transport system substrate-binding protein
MTKEGQEPTLIGGLVMSRKPWLHFGLFLPLLAALLLVLAVACGEAAEETTAPPAATEAPTVAMTEAPTAAMTEAPTAAMTEAPTAVMTEAPVAMTEEPEAMEELTACELVQPAAASNPQYGGSLRVAMFSDWSTLDPGFAEAGLAINTVANVYDPLLFFNLDGSYRPGLATGCEVNADLTSYTFHLREGVKFHHGKDFTAEDVVFSISRHLDEDLQTTAFPTWSNVVDQIVAVDDYTVRFDLTIPDGFFLNEFPVYQNHILPTDVDIDKMASGEQVYGTGPFTVAEVLPGERVTLVRNPDYWDEGLPYVDELHLMGIPENLGRVEALKNGDVDIALRLDFSSVAGVSSHDETVALSVPSPTVNGMSMDVTQEPFDNLLVRKAMQAAADREQIHQTMMLGLGSLAYDHPIPPDDGRYFASDLDLPEYDIELAKSLLAEAGYPDGIDITLHTGEVGPGMIEMAVAYKESAAPAGIRVNVQRNPSEQFWSEVFGVEPFTVLWWPGRSNPNRTFTLGYLDAPNSAWATHNYGNEELDSLILRAKGESLEQQRETYRRVQEILIENVPVLYVTFRPKIHGARTNVRDFAPSPIHPDENYRVAWLEQ